MAQKAEETNRLVVAINEQRSEQEQLEVVKKTAEALEAAGTAQAQARRRKGGALVSPKVRRLEGALGVIARFDLSELTKGSIPTDFQEHLRSRVQEGIRVLDEVRKRI